MKLISEESGIAPGRYYYEVKRTYEADDGRRVVGIGGFAGGLLGTPAHEINMERARQAAEEDALEQLRGPDDGRG
jgi:hypothetical protein